MFPSHASLYGAPVELNSYMNDNISFWESVYGFNMNPVAQKVLENKISGQKVFLEVGNFFVNPFRKHKICALRQLKNKNELCI